MKRSKLGLVGDFTTSLLFWLIFLVIAGAAVYFLVKRVTS